MTQAPLVLLVDDEPLLRDTLVQIFEGEGFRAASAADGTTAVGLAEHFAARCCDLRCAHARNKWD